MHQASRQRTTLGRMALMAALLTLTATASVAGSDDPAAPADPAPPTFASVQTFMDDAVRAGRIPSAIAMIARDGAVVWQGTSGEMGPGIRMRADAILPLASIGKLYTAVAAMILVERGVIALDDPVSRFLPEFAELRVAVVAADGTTQLVTPGQPMTVYHLLTHTSGLTLSGEAFWAAWDANTDLTTAHLARALAALPLTASPGERFEYGPTGAAYEVLGAVIEAASGQTLEAFMFENIFTPLGLHDSYFYVPDEKSDRLPACYREVDGVLQLDRPYGVDFPRTTFFHGGGGVAASPQDLLRFTRLFLEGGAVDGVRILQPETVRLMMRDQVGAKSTFSRGLGWGFGAAVREGADGAPLYYGWVGGGYAILWMEPQTGRVAYFAFPLTPPGDNGLLQEFQRLVGAAVAAG